MTDLNAPKLTRYVSAHRGDRDTKGPGDGRPTALQIVRDNDLEGKLDGKIVLITGTSSGIGIETARAMKATGAHVYATVRNQAKGEQALADMLEPGKLELMSLDLNSLNSVRSFASSFLEKTNGKLNILINNAGIMATPEGKTEDGFETQFGVCHLAHFLLFQSLKPALLSSSSSDFNSRVVSVASTGHRYNPINFENIMLAGEYEPNRAYAHAKLANIYMANEIDRRYGSRGLHALSLHPGGIASGLQVHVQEFAQQMYALPHVQAYMKSPQQGAATSVFAAIDNCLEGIGGVYLEDCQICPPVKDGYTIFDVGYEKWAYDHEKEARLWKISNELVGFEEDGR